MDINILLIIGLVGISAGAIAYTFLFNNVQTEKSTSKRLNRVSTLARQKGTTPNRDINSDAAKRRKSIEENLKDLESERSKKNKAKNIKSIPARIAQAGLSNTPKQFYFYSVLFGFLLFFFAFIISGTLLLAIGIGFVGAVGLPRWLLSFLIKRRQNKFTQELPNALDVMTRSIKSGLPLNDAIRLIASDGQEPVKSEFLKVVEEQQVGFSVPEAIQRMTIRLPLPEVNFFSTVITIQSQSGGNLSEALSNLSKVLRERKKMRQKINAVSMEAKASAAIIGSLPFVVMFIVSVMSPDYMTVLFTDPRGHLILAISGIWMTIGLFVMRNMINFDI